MNEPTTDITLVIYSEHVHLYPNPPPIISSGDLAVAAMIPGDDFPETPLIQLLRGPLLEFLQYSRQEASLWLINIAHGICDPANCRGSLVVWREDSAQWLEVTGTDPLTASMYCYNLPAGVTVGLSKISRREGRSLTAASGNASTMANHVMERDGACWVSGMIGLLINSHICPKRMGDHTARVIFETFTSYPPPPNLSIFDTIFGLNLQRNLDALFDKYELGFHFVAPVSSYLLTSKFLLINYLEPLRVPFVR